MGSTLISFRLPDEIYSALIAEKEHGESDGVAAIRLLGERLGVVSKAKGYVEIPTMEKIQELIEVEVARQNSNLVALLTDTRNQLEDIRSGCLPKVSQPKATTAKKSSSSRKLTKISDKND